MVEAGSEGRVQADFEFCQSLRQRLPKAVLKCVSDRPGWTRGVTKQTKSHKLGIGKRRKGGEWNGGRERDVTVYTCDYVTISNYTILLTITLVYTPCMDVGCWYSNLLAVASQDSVLSLSFWVVEAGMP